MNLRKGMRKLFRRVYRESGGKVAENEKFSVYIYPHPDESGQEKWHVHIVRRSDGVDAKISLWTYELLRPTRFDRNTVKRFVVWVHDNRHYLRRKWFKKVTKPFWKSIRKWED